MISVRRTLALLVAILFIISCGDQQGQTYEQQNISFEQVKLSKKDGNCDGENTDYCAEIIIEYPVFTINGYEDIQKKINKNISINMFFSVDNEDTKKSFDELADEFINDYKEFRRDVPDFHIAWYFERFGTVLFYNKDFISFRITENSYLGGAHPNSYSVLTVFDLITGNKVSLNDIFNKGYQTKLNQIAEKEFRVLKEISVDESLNDAGFWFEDNKFTINDNFALTDEGITFYYNNYEITAYAYGPTELVIPISKISEIIKKDGILAELMKL